MRGSLWLAAVMILGACGDDPLGGQCGSGQFAEASAVFPDSGVNSSATVEALLLQHDTQELTELVVFQMWPSGTAAPAIPGRRIWLLRGDGRVLLDTTGVQFQVATVPEGRSNYTIFRWIRTASERNIWYDAFAADDLWIAVATQVNGQPSTIVRLSTVRAETLPIAWCG